MAQTRKDALQEAIIGLPRVAEVIAAIPANARLKALTAVEGSYRQSALDLGYNDSEAQCWVVPLCFGCGTKWTRVNRLKKKGKPVGPQSIFCTSPTLLYDTERDVSACRRRWLE